MTLQKSDLMQQNIYVTHTKGIGKTGESVRVDQGNNWTTGEGALEGKLGVTQVFAKCYLLMHSSTSNSRPEPACILPVYTPGKKSVLSFCLTM